MLASDRRRSANCREVVEWARDVPRVVHGTAMGEHVDEVGKITCPVSFQNAFAGRANADIRVYPGGGPQLLDAAQAGLRRSGGEGAARARARLLQGHVRRVTSHR